MEAIEELRDLTDRLADLPMPSAAGDGLMLRKTACVTGFEAMIYEPMLYFVLQGAKQLLAGGQTIDYSAPSFLILSVDVPVDARVLNASRTEPFLGIELRLPRRDVSGILFELPEGPKAVSGPAFGVGTLTPALIDTLVRLVKSLETPSDTKPFASLYTRELLYRVAQGPLGFHLRDALGIGGRHHQIRRAIDWIRIHYQEKIRIETLADVAGMSVTTFHRQFKMATNISPGAYHKRVRLHHARGLLAEMPTVSSVAFAVGYESTTQFNREYARQFGAPPGHDAMRIKRSVR